jgi:hypothetical protein
MGLPQMSGLSVWGGLDGGSGSPQDITPRALIVRVYQMLGVIHSGQTPSGSLMSEGLEELNQLIDSWNTERLTVPQILREVGDLAAGVRTYDVPDEPPVTGASLILSGGTKETPLDLLPEDPRRRGLAAGVYGFGLGVFAGSVAGLYFEGRGAGSTLVLGFTPAAGDQLVLYRWGQLQTFGDLDTAATVPAGYALALRFNLAVQIAAGAAGHAKTQTLLGEMKSQAIEYKRLLKARNSKTPLARVDSAILIRRPLR